MKRNSFRIALILLLLLAALSLDQYIAKNHTDRLTANQPLQASNNHSPHDHESEEGSGSKSVADRHSLEATLASEGDRNTKIAGANSLQLEHGMGVSSLAQPSTRAGTSKPGSVSESTPASGPSPNTATAAVPNYTQVTTESRQKMPSMARIFGEGMGKFTVDGVAAVDSITLFDQNKVDVDGGRLISVISAGNHLLFAPKSQFVALLNAYELKSGSSNVSTSTGMTAVVPDCFTVSPVHPDIRTYFEVNWWGVSAFVYARVQDVDIRYWVTGAPRPGTLHPRPPDRQWVLKQGHVARLLDARECKPLVDLWPQGELPPGVNVALAAGAIAVPGTIAGELWGTGSQPNLSAESPDQ